MNISNTVKPLQRASQALHYGYKVGLVPYIEYNSVEFNLKDG